MSAPRPLRVMVLGCSAVTTGEFTMAMEFLKRSTRVKELHALVGNGLMANARWHGAQVHLYPSLMKDAALQKMGSALQVVRPDVLLVADMLLAFGLSPEFGAVLGGLMHEASNVFRVVGLDLYDLEDTALDVDIFGRPMLTHAPVLPTRMGRIHPVPSLTPQKNRRGRGYYPMLPDGTPLSAAEKAAVRAELGIPADHALVTMTTSAWQHRLASHPEGTAVAMHFPALMFRLLDLAAERSRKVTLLHVGPQAFEPAGLTHTTYVHAESRPPAQFQRLLAASDVYLSPNMPASTAVRAASFRVPVATLYAPAPCPPEHARGEGPAFEALRTYLTATRGGYAFQLWPVGLHGMLERNLVDNPFTQTQARMSILQPQQAVDRLTELLLNGESADALRGAQGGFFARLSTDVGTVDDALSAALDGL